MTRNHWLADLKTSTLSEIKYTYYSCIKSFGIMAMLLGTRKRLAEAYFQRINVLRFENKCFCSALAFTYWQETCDKIPFQ